MNTISIKNKVIGEGTPKIIIPLMGKTEEQLFQEFNEIKTLAPDIIEWRVDVYEHVEDLEAVKQMLSELRRLATDSLLLFTFRSHKEGGNKEISDRNYVELLQTVIRTKNIDLIDIELFTNDSAVKELVALAEENGIFVVMSNHDFHKTPKKEEIIHRLRKMQELGAHIPKIAVMPNSVQDVITLLDATNTMITKYANRPIITMSMAEIGLISRLAGEVFGSACTFGAGKEASAPGQIPVSELRNVLEIINKNIR
ncbi:type I 3-dehydroquinate dehydratase [Bacillus sp. AFS076308]|uniref:type I 3-dehydroquinate dehydratase n=1 Tax=unclassified Bacillus (in: firmicutes) TaxID=185979 RepID=UPI000BF37AC5|nr:MULTISPECIES: type I 3-dehydroquinate dehydratase [unclassified Bacillus (in: firmicutes)]PFO09389.1 type I 3-dehydroquinate dehydratase [Bacillus sp. AFS076308]PGV50367.1 type I 3-dehydroquinate dehydratase [Bacillus sp. AFS037270]